MNLINLFVGLVKTGTSSDHYYRSMNNALKSINGDYTMLHYPMDGENNDTFQRSQENLTDYCLSLVGDMEGKTVLEIGCGNGVQSKYIQKKAKPGFMYGIDLNEESIQIANDQLMLRKISNMKFHVDDAQQLKQIPNASIDVALNIESAFHYPDKKAFIDQLSRVLKPGGKFLVADVLTTRQKQKQGFKARWKQKMGYHHWPFERYMDLFQGSKLKLMKSEDITESVIRGFQNYRMWIKNGRSSGWLRDQFFKVFYFINVSVNVYLLRRRRKYMVFVGTNRNNPA